MLEEVLVGIGSVLGIFGNIGPTFLCLVVVGFVDSIPLVSPARPIYKGLVIGLYGLAYVPKIGILGILIMILVYGIVIHIREQSYHILSGHWQNISGGKPYVGQVLGV